MKFKLFLHIFLLTSLSCSLKYKENHNHDIDNSHCENLSDEDSFDSCKVRSKKSVEHNQIIRSERFNR
jgi:hypothetical protein